MKLIAENLHIISKATREAVISRDKEYIANLIKNMAGCNPDWIDLNIGPARADFSGSMKWLTKILNNITDIPVSFDSTNADEIGKGLSAAKNPSECLINSTNADDKRLKKVLPLAKEYEANLIALTMNSELGIPKECDARLELAMKIQAAAENIGISNEKLYFDPLVLPLGVDQSQAGECLNTIRMLKESFEPPVKTTIGLSNVSNGCPRELRQLINRVFFVMASGCGLDSAIVDVFDSELLRIAQILECGAAESQVDMVYHNLFSLMRDFGDIEDLKYDKNDPAQSAVFKTAEIILNKKVYSNSYLSI